MTPRVAVAIAVVSIKMDFTTFRRAYVDLSMTSYRDFNRKRVGFDFAYQMLTYLLKGIDKN